MTASDHESIYNMILLPQQCIPKLQSTSVLPYPVPSLQRCCVRIICCSTSQPIGYGYAPSFISLAFSPHPDDAEDFGQFLPMLFSGFLYQRVKLSPSFPAKARDFLHARFCVQCLGGLKLVVQVIDYSHFCRNFRVALL
ncbi:MAG: hypothetical protein ACU843_16965 [Gammaproteobacteria bacterium]